MSRRYEDLPTIGGLDELAELVEHSRQSRDLYVRWSRGPAADLAGEPRAGSSRDSLTGVPLPGLSVNSLAVEQWVGWISGTAMRESVRVVEAQGSDEWGPLDRRTRT